MTQQDKVDWAARRKQDRQDAQRMRKLAAQRAEILEKYVQVDEHYDEIEESFVLAGIQYTRGETLYPGAKASERRSFTRVKPEFTMKNQLYTCGREVARAQGVPCVGVARMQVHWKESSGEEKSMTIPFVLEGPGHSPCVVRSEPLEVDAQAPTTVSLDSMSEVWYTQLEWGCHACDKHDDLDFMRQNPCATCMHGMALP